MSVLTSGFLICTRIYSKNHLNVFTIPSSGYLRFSYDKKHPTIKYLLIFKSKKINPIIKLAVSLIRVYLINSFI